MFSLSSTPQDWRVRSCPSNFGQLEYTAQKEEAEDSEEGKSGATLTMGNAMVIEGIITWNCTHNAVKVVWFVSTVYLSGFLCLQKVRKHLVSFAKSALVSLMIYHVLLPMKFKGTYLFLQTLVWHKLFWQVQPSQDLSESSGQASRPFPAVQFSIGRDKTSLPWLS